MNIAVRFQNDVKDVVRWIRSFKRPSKQKNTALLAKQHLTADSFVIREATPEDAGAIAALHVRTWNDTYSADGPSVRVREYQWRELFKAEDKNWFVLVIQHPSGELVGFAKAQPYNHPDLPQFSGELNKLYLLRNYQRLGLGKKLVGHVARKLVNRGINSMVLFGTPQNPSCDFYKSLGGEKLNKKDEPFLGNYGWCDLEKLAVVCKAPKITAQ